MNTFPHPPLDLTVKNPRTIAISWVIGSEKFSLVLLNGGLLQTCYDTHHKQKKNLFQIQIVKENAKTPCIFICKSLKGKRHKLTIYHESSLKI